MSWQVSTSKEGEGDFNFDNWIIKHDLVEVKELFVKHNATTIAALKLTSTELQSLMIDPALFSKAHAIPKIMNAMQSMSTVRTESIIVVIGEDEQKAIDTIQENLKDIDKFEAISNKLNDDLPKSISRVNNEKLKQINVTINKVNKTFDNILDAVKRKKENVLNKLNDIKSRINNSDNDNKNNDDDEKEVDLTSSIQDNIKKSQQFLQEQSQMCRELTSSNKNKLERKQKIINIGKNVKEKYNKTQKVLNNNIENVKKSIKCNNDTVVNIDFMINHKKYNKTIEYMNDIGMVINKTYNKTERKQDNEYLFVDQDENKIKELKKQISKNIKIIKELNDKVNNKNDQNRLLQQELTSKTQQYETIKHEKNKAYDENNLLQQELNSKTIQYERITQEKEAQLISSLSFDMNGKYRWYCEDDEKQVDIKLGTISDDRKQIVFIDGTKNQNVSKENLLIEPKVSKNDKNNYNKIIKCIHILKENAIITLQRNTIYKDEWDTMLKHDGYTISQNVVTKTSDTGNWRTVFLSKIVKRGRHEWKFKIETSVGINHVMFGIWDNSNDPKEIFSKYLNGIKNRAYGIYSYGTGCQLRPYETTSSGTTYGVALKQNDTITMSIDLDALTLSYSINNKDYGVAFNIKKTQYKAAISIYHRNSAIKLL